MRTFKIYPVQNLELEVFLLYSYPYSYDLYIKYFRSNFSIHPSLPMLALINVDNSYFKTK